MDPVREEGGPQPDALRNTMLPHPITVALQPTPACNACMAPIAAEKMGRSSACLKGDPQNPPLQRLQHCRVFDEPLQSTKRRRSLNHVQEPVCRALAHSAPKPLTSTTSQQQRRTKLPYAKITT